MCIRDRESARTPDSGNIQIEEKGQKRNKDICAHTISVRFERTRYASARVMSDASRTWESVDARGWARHVLFGLPRKQGDRVRVRSDRSCLTSGSAGSTRFDSR
eukprot:1852680-Pyramimonas_sp.AAC.1